MLATQKIAGAFAAICEEAEQALEQELPPTTEKRLKTIISIARHQSDIRGLPQGSCPPSGHGDPS